MIGRCLAGRLITLLLGLIAFAQPDGFVSGQELDRKERLRLIADAMGNQSRMIAVGISSLAKLQIEEFDIETVWGGFQDNPLDLMSENRNGLGLIDMSKTDLAELEAAPGLYAVMKFWPSEKSQERSFPNTSPGHLLVAGVAVRPDVIHLLLDAIQDDRLILKAASIDIGKIDPSISLLDLPLLHHQGVHEYLKASDIELAGISVPGQETVDPPTTKNEIAGGSLSEEDGSPTKETGSSSSLTAEKINQTPIPDLTEGGKSFTLLFETDSAELGSDDMKSVAEACRYAATLPRARFIISGHTDTVGSALYNKKLASVRAERVADAIRNDPRFREALSVVDYGESNLAVTTGDNVPEARNRRVKLTIVADR
ncbi:MAG: OmpA family protein [Geminicoccaceae bacterium]